jgi:hypothetical protein
VPVARNRQQGVGPILASPTSRGPVEFPPAISLGPPTEGALSLKELHRLQSIRLPAADALRSPAPRGRFAPRPLVGVAPGALDPRVAETFQYPSITSVGLRSLLGAHLVAEGFSVASDPVGVTARKRSNADAVELTGAVLGERGLRADPTETRRRDRSRYGGVLVGASATGILGFVSLTHLGTLLGLLIIPAGLGVAALLISLFSFENASYWSEVVVMQYTGQVPSGPNGEAARAVPATYELRLWVVRALTRDWGTWGASGRNVVAGIQGEGLDPLRSSLRHSITAGAAPEPARLPIDESVPMRNALDALGQ